MKKLSSILCATLTLVFAFGLAFTALDVSAVPAIDTTAVTDGADFAASLSGDEKPDIALSSDLKPAIIGIINYILTFLGLVAVAFIIYAGILLVTDAGDEENVGKAKKIILYAAVGIVIVLLSYTIVNAVFGVGDVVA